MDGTMTSSASLPTSDLITAASMSGCGLSARKERPSGIVWPADQLGVIGVIAPVTDRGPFDFIHAGLDARDAALVPLSSVT